MVDLPCIAIKLKAPVDVYSRREGMLPRLGFGLEIECRIKRNFDKNTTFHPMVSDVSAFMHLINPHFTLSLPETEAESSASKIDSSSPLFFFASLEELKEKTCLPKGYQYTDGSWKDMLLCVPAVQHVRVQFDWPYDGFRRTYRTTPRSKGVTVGQFVSAVRRTLKHAEEDVRGFACQMSVFCEDCGRSDDPDEWDEYDDWI